MDGKGPDEQSGSVATPRNGGRYTMDDRPQVLPEFKGARDGSGCDNPDCDASARHIRVLSEHETKRMYPRKDALPQWPFPPQATHACEKCGYCYQGVAGQEQFTDPDTDSEPPEVNIEEYDWDPESVYDGTVRESIEALVRGRPESADMSEIGEAVYRYVPGAGVDDAKSVVSSMDVDLSAHSLADFM